MNPFDEGPIYEVQRFYEQTIVERTDTSEITGIVDKNQLTIAFTGAAGNRSVVVSPTATQWDFYVLGEKHTIITNLYLVCSTSTGLWFVYIDSDKILKQTNVWSEILLRDVALVCSYFYSSGDQQLLRNMCHGIVMDWKTHSYLNEVQGNVWTSGLECTEFATIPGDGSTDDHVKVVMTSGTIRNSDISFSLPVGSQQFSPFLETDAVYRVGGTTEINKAGNSTRYMPAYMTAGFVVKYNHISGGVWTLSNVLDKKYFNSFLFAGQYIEDRLYCFAAGAQYDSYNEAISNALDELDTLTSDLVCMTDPLVAVLTYFRDTSFTNNTKCILVGILDTRKGRTLKVRSHTTLKDLNDDTHPIYPTLNGREEETQLTKGEQQVGEGNWEYPHFEDSIASPICLDATRVGDWLYTGNYLNGVNAYSFPALALNDTDTSGTEIGEILNIDDDYLYATSRGVNDGLLVYDITVPGTLTLVFGPDNVDDYASMSRDGNYLYVAGPGSFYRYYDITIPAVPVLVNSFNHGSTHAGDYNTCDIEVYGSHVYLTTGVDGLQIFTKPVGGLVGTHNYGTYAYNGLSLISISGTLYACCATDHDLLIIDCSAPAAPVLTSTIEFGQIVSRCETKEVYSNTYLIGCYADGYKIYQIDNPSSPSFLCDIPVNGAFRPVYSVPNLFITSVYATGPNFYYYDITPKIRLRSQEIVFPNRNDSTDFSRIKHYDDYTSVYAGATAVGGTTTNTIFLESNDEDLDDGDPAGDKIVLKGSYLIRDGRHTQYYTWGASVPFCHYYYTARGTRTSPLNNVLSDQIGLWRWYAHRYGGYSLRASSAQYMRGNYEYYQCMHGLDTLRRVFALYDGELDLEHNTNIGVYKNANQDIATTGATVYTTLNFQTTEWDTTTWGVGSAWSDPTYTCRRAGKYAIKSQIRAELLSGNLSEFYLCIYHNSTKIAESACYNVNWASYNYQSHADKEANLSSGDTITIKVRLKHNGTPGTVRFLPGLAETFLNIWKTG